MQRERHSLCEAVSDIRAEEGKTVEFDILEGRKICVELFAVVIHRKREGEAIRWSPCPCRTGKEIRTANFFKIILFRIKETCGA